MDYKETENRLAFFAEKLETNILRYLNPINAESEKEKFFKALENREIYNPVFQYIPKNPLLYYFSISPEYENMIRELKSLGTDDSFLGLLFSKKKAQLLRKMALIKNIGGIDFTTKSIEFYGRPRRRTLKRAFEILEQRPERSKRDIPAQKAVGILQKELSRKKLGFKVAVDENLSSRAAVFFNEKQLSLKPGKYSAEDLKRFKLHEIQTHIYRFVNGTKQPINIFSTGLSEEWVATEEGLAAKNEEIFGCQSREIQRAYAGRAVAIDYAFSHSFFETFLYLKSFFDEETAYAITQRVKRGVVRTERSGAFTKDFLYLEGKLLLDEFVERGGSLPDLYYGKISTHEIDIVKKIGGLKKPALLPRYPKKFNA